MTKVKTRIGYISPTVLEVACRDYYQFAPKNTELVGITCNVEDWNSEAELARSISALQQNVSYLAARRVDFIIHGGGVPVCTRGRRFDEFLLGQISSWTDIPATTTIRAAIESFRHLGAHKIAMISPYPHDRNRIVSEFLGDYDINVAVTGGTPLGFYEIQNSEPDDIYALVETAMRSGGSAECIYLPCAQWPVLDLIAKLEEDFGVPVVTSTTANFFIAFSRLGAGGLARGYGKLLSSLHR